MPGPLFCMASPCRSKAHQRRWSPGSARCASIPTAAARCSSAPPARTRSTLSAPACTLRCAGLETAGAQGRAPAAQCMGVMGVAGRTPGMPYSQHDMAPRPVLHTPQEYAAKASAGEEVRCLACQVRRGSQGWVGLAGGKQAGWPASVSGCPAPAAPVAVMALTSLRPLPTATLPSGQARAGPQPGSHQRRHPGGAACIRHSTRCG